MVSSSSKTILKNKKPGFEPKITDSLIYSTVSIILSLRNLVHKPDSILDELEIRPGMRKLDFGCGPGHFAVYASKKIQSEGRVYALDYHPMAFAKLDKKIQNKDIKNIVKISPDCKTGLPDSSIDIVLLYYVFNDLPDKIRVLDELHRVLKPDGILSLYEFGQEKISFQLGEIGIFQLEKKLKRTHSFSKSKIFA